MFNNKKPDVVCPHPTAVHLKPARKISRFIGRQTGRTDRENSTGSFSLINAISLVITANSKHFLVDRYLPNVYVWKHRNIGNIQSNSGCTKTASTPRLTSPLSSEYRECSPIFIVHADGSSVKYAASSGLCETQRVDT